MFARTATLPKDNNYICVSNIAKEIGCSNQTVIQIASRLGYDLLVFKKNNTSSGYFTEDQKNKISSAYHLYGNNYKMIKRDESDDVTPEDLHPLVKDKRYLQLNVWPDIIPACFQEC